MSTNFLSQIRKSISSPKSKRKLSFQSPGSRELLDTSNSSLLLRIFGSTLPEVARESPTKNGVPFFVCRIAEYLSEHGLDQEGLFRKNGNIRVMDALRAKFESDGDADLETAGDVFAAASLMKQFFRELREPLIPDYLIDQMIRVKQKFDFDSPGFLKELHPLLDELQLVNYKTLKYVVQFLLRVSMHEASNKMSVLSLAIVFGPSLFRSAPGMTGLKEQGMITPILIKFIQHSHDLFNRTLTDSTTHRLLNTSQLTAASDAPQKPSPPPKPKRKPHLFNTSPTSQPSPSPDSFLSPATGHTIRPTEDPPSFREVMSPWQCRLKSPVSPSPAASHNFKSELQLVIREALDLYMWGEVSDEESSKAEETRETPRARKPDQRMTVRSLVSQFEDSSVVYGTAFKISDISNASATLKHSTSNYDLHSLTRAEDTPPEGDELFFPTQTLDFLTLDRPKGPARKAPSREGRSRSASNDLSGQEMDGFFGVDTTGNTTTSTTNPTLTLLSQLSTNSTPNTSQPVSGQLSDSTLDNTRGKLMDELRDVKREIRRFQLDFRQKNGRKPTLQEKECIRPVVLRYGEIKFQLGEAQDGTLEETMSPLSPRHECRESTSVPTSDTKDTEAAWKYKIEMNTIANTLQEKRKQSARPSQIHAMTFEQLKQEKRELQKALLVYEGKYGRPQREAVIVMRPFYDRYRAIKQFLHKHQEGRLHPMRSGCGSLQSLNSLHQTETTLSTIYASMGSVYPPEMNTAVLPDSDTINTYNASGFDLQSFPSLASLASPEHRYPSPIPTNHTNSLKDFSLVSSLHEFKEFLASEGSLKPQDYWLSYHYIRARKKELKQLLQDFEKEIRDNFDRKPNKLDRETKMPEYKEYKLLKDKMSFLESNFNVSTRGQGGQVENELSP